MSTKSEIDKYINFSLIFGTGQASGAGLLEDENLKNSAQGSDTPCSPFGGAANTPHPQCLTTPHQPHVGGGGAERGVGHVGLGGGVGQWVGGVLEEYRVHMHTYTHVGVRITVGRN